jgi:FMN-dependent NADH-azoreductase
MQRFNFGTLETAQHGDVSELEKYVESSRQDCVKKTVKLYDISCMRKLAYFLYKMVYLVISISFVNCNFSGRIKKYIKQLSENDSTVSRATNLLTSYVFSL